MISKEELDDFLICYFERIRKFSISGMEYEEFRFKMASNYHNYNSNEQIALDIREKVKEWKRSHMSLNINYNW